MRDSANIKHATPPSAQVQLRGGRARARLGLATLIVLGSLTLMACAAPSVQQSDAPDSESGEAGPASPETEPELGFSGIPSVEELRMDAALDAQGLAAAFNDLISDWISAGANSGNVTLRSEGEFDYLSQPDYLQRIVDAATPIFAEALFGKNWSDPKFAASIEQLADNQFRTLGAYFTTQGSDFPRPYAREERLVDVRDVVEDATSKSMEVTIEYFDNGPEIGTDYTINGLRNSVALNFVNENGYWVLSAPLEFNDVN